MSSIASTAAAAADATTSPSSSSAQTQPQQQLHHHHHHHHHQQLLLLHEHRSVLTRSMTLNPQSPAPRPEELRVKPWYEEVAGASKDSPPPADQSSCPVYQSYELDNGSIIVYNNSTQQHNHNHNDLGPRAEAASTRTSSIESEAARSTVPRKAYMDLNDAMALLDETCPNPDVSPQMTPRTPRTPLTPHPRNKRARSKSSDNSSNYSSERLNEKPEKDKERKRPFLKKIGISMTEDRPLLAKLAPRIMGKPYLEKIGPSRAVDKPFLEKIGSSRTLDKFIFDTPKRKEADNYNNSSSSTIPEEPERKLTAKERRDEIRGFSTGERRRSGKNFLLKMYSFETEDLEETSLVMKAPHRDPLRGASLDDVLESGPSSMPRINELCAMTNSDIETPSASVAELVRCRVTTSEEIISSNSCLNSPMDVNSSWGNSPKRRDQAAKSSAGKEEIDKENNESVPNSPTKRTHSVTPEKVTAVYRDLEKVKNGRQSSDEILDKRKSRFDRFETRSSDNLTKERVATPVFAEIGSKNINGKGSSSSVMSTASSTNRQLHDKFDSQEIFKESYAEFKLRTQGNLHTSNALKRLVVREKTISPSFDLGFSSKEAMMEKIKSEGSPKVRSKSAETERQKVVVPKDKLEVGNNRRLRNRSVLRKQQGVDHAHYHPNEINEPDTSSNSNNNQHRQMVHEPSQETLDLLSELQKVKSQLKTPSMEKTCESDGATDLKPFPKRILLTDKEFCLSVERENSIRRPSRVNTLEGKPELLAAPQSSEIGNRSPDKKKTLGASFFEKRCLSLDYADEDRSHKSEPRTVSLASARSPRSEDLLESTEVGFITCDSKSYSSDVFNSPDDTADKSLLDAIAEKDVQQVDNNEAVKDVVAANDEVAKSVQVSQQTTTTTTTTTTTKKLKEEKTRGRSKSPRLAEKVDKSESTSTDEKKEEPASEPRVKSSGELEPTNREPQASPKKKSDSFDIPSPKATPFRMKKRLGRISVEETVKQESFAVSKVDCKEVAVQKKAKCLPL